MTEKLTLGNFEAEADSGGSTEGLGKHFLIMTASELREAIEERKKSYDILLDFEKFFEAGIMLRHIKNLEALLLQKELEGN